MMDEPTGSLDTKSTTEVLELVRRLNRERGISVIQVTHSPSAAAYADRIITVADGEVLES
jgi:putative ABC transport system ATP-binding protein